MSGMIVYWLLSTNEESVPKPRKVEIRWCKIVLYSGQLVLSRSRAFQQYNKRGAKPQSEFWTQAEKKVSQVA